MEKIAPVDVIFNGFCFSGNNLGKSNDFWNIMKTTKQVPETQIWIAVYILMASRLQLYWNHPRF